VRYAVDADLEFTSQDGYVPRAVVGEKIRSRQVVVAERDSRPVGYARIEKLWSTIPYLVLIRVMPALRRQGIGRAMIAFLERQLSEQGHRVLLSSSQSNEPEPQAWHRRVGFRECGIIRGINADGSDEIFFQKELG
jgi:ribosomal protein S18 acetylase RimI-like enzyme